MKIKTTIRLLLEEIIKLDEPMKSSILTQVRLTESDFDLLLETFDECALVTLDDAVQFIDTLK